MTRAAIFVDGSNFYHMQKSSLGWRIEPRKLLELLKQKYEIVEAIYYTAEAPDGGDAAFLRALVRMGYSVVKKDLKNVGRENCKGNLDVELALDMVLTSDHYDVAILVSGDGDFRKPLEVLRARGKRFKVLSTSECIAWELRELAGENYIDVREFESDLRDYARGAGVVADISKGADHG